MKFLIRNHAFWTALACCLFLPFTTVLGQNRTPQRILLICSYDASFPTFPHQIEGIHSVLEIDDYDLEIEFIDSKRIPGPTTLQYFAKAMEVKTKVLRPYDLIITADDNALTFILEYGESLFPQVPVVFFGVNDKTKGLTMNQIPQITGILEYASFQKNIDLMHQMFPKATRYHILIDGLPSTQGDWATFQTECRFPSEIEVNPLDLTQMTFDQVYAEVETFDSNDLILFLGSYTDNTGKLMGFYESISTLLKHCHIPVFHPYQHGVGQGFIGGMVVSHYTQAKEAAIIAKQVLEGTDISSFPVIEKSPNRFYLDEQLIQKFGVSQQLLPKEVTWVNPDQSFLRRYKHWIYGIALAMVILILLAIGFYRLWKREYESRKELEESEIRNNTLFENPFAIMLVMDPQNGSIIDANNTAVEFYGYSKEELLKLKITDINTLPDSEIKKLIHRVRNEKHGMFRFKHKLKNGEIRDVEVVTGQVHFKGDPLIFSIVKDNTEVIQHEIKLKEAKLEAEKANKAKSEFLSMMTHEMRTPLNPILGFSSLLLEEVEEAQQVEQLKMIFDSAENLKALIDDILHFNKLNSDSIELKNRDFNLYDLLKSIHKIFENSCRTNEVLFQNDTRSPLPENMVLFSDPGILNHIVSNLLCNACKYTENGTVVLKSKLIEQKESQCHIQLEVEDNGIGIDPQSQKLIFEPFRQVENSSTHTNNGVGLGLSICKKMSALIGAELQIGSELGKGSKFSIDLWIPLAST